MSIFSPNFKKPGPGISKNAPPKKGISLFFEILIREFWQLIKLNLIFIISCLPIVTIGASIAGLSYSTTKMVRDVPNDVWSDFKDGFKKNIKPATFCGLIGLVLFGSGFYGFYLYTDSPVLLLVSTAILILFTSIWIYVYPMMTSTTLSFSSTIRNAFLLSIAQFYYGLPTALLCLAYIIMQALLFPLSIPLSVFLGFSIPSFIASFAAWAGI